MGFFTQRESRELTNAREERIAAEAELAKMEAECRDEKVIAELRQTNRLLTDILAALNRPKGE